MSVLDDDLIAAATATLTALRGAAATLATAESCTGGLIAGAMTEIAGSSDVVCCGFVTYSNAAKTAMLGVPEDMLAAHGAVSEPVARAMVAGALSRGDVGIAVSCTGIAGPGGATDTKPVGLVYIGCGRAGGVIDVAEHRFDGDRAAVRRQTVLAALAMVRRACGADAL